MGRALFIIDVQNDFTEGGALGVEGGAAVAAGITELLRKGRDRYSTVFASRDWHDSDNDNGGHFAVGTPDFQVTWPRHCVAGTSGAEYHPGLDQSLIDVHVLKGQGRPAYSIFDGVTADGRSVETVLDELGIAQIDVAGIATDYCVLASALDAIGTDRPVRVITNLIAGVAPASSAAALDQLTSAGAELIDSRESL